jgi:ABC-type transporter Mla subunit MlaD
MYGVTVDFRIKRMNIGYIWIDSRVHVASDILGNRYLEILKGVDGAPTALDKRSGILVLNRAAAEAAFEGFKKKAAEDPDLSEQAILIDATNQLNALLTGSNGPAFYTNLGSAKPYWMAPFEPPGLSERIESLISSVEVALPNILRLTNQVAGVLTNANGATLELKTTLAQTQPVLSNLNVITSNLRDPQGSLGNWMIPTNINARLEQTLVSANAALIAAQGTLESADTNMNVLVVEIGHSLQQLSNLTSNLNSQVEINTNLIGEISSAIVHTDDLVQGLKRHWFLRSAFKTNAPPAKTK